MLRHGRGGHRRLRRRLSGRRADGRSSPRDKSRSAFSKRPLAFAVWGGKAMVVDQGMEAVNPTVPDVPDERALLEQRAVLFEEPVAEPVIERLAGDNPPRQARLASLAADQSAPNASARRALRRLFCRGPRPSTAVRQTIPSSIQRDFASRPSGPMAGQSKKLEPTNLATAHRYDPHAGYSYMNCDDVAAGWIGKDPTCKRNPVWIRGRCDRRTSRSDCSPDQAKAAVMEL